MGYLFRPKNRLKNLFFNGGRHDHEGSLFSGGSEAGWPARNRTHHDGPEGRADREAPQTRIGLGHFRGDRQQRHRRAVRSGRRERPGSGPADARARLGRGHPGPQHVDRRPSGNSEDLFGHLAHPRSQRRLRQIRGGGPFRHSRIRPRMEIEDRPARP